MPEQEAKPKAIKITTNPCVVCGQTSSVIVYQHHYNQWMSGKHVQDVWPNASADMRELLISGTHSACWDKLFPAEKG